MDVQCVSFQSPKYFRQNFIVSQFIFQSLQVACGFENNSLIYILNKIKKFGSLNLWWKQYSISDGGISRYC